MTLITSHSQGFGRGILETFVREGGSVLGMDAQAKDGAVEGYTENQAYQIQGNVTEETSCRRALETSISHFGKVPSIVVHNAGCGPANKTSCNVLILEMKKNGPGSIVVISSEFSIRPGPRQAWYCATNAGISAATKAMALYPIGHLVEPLDVANAARFLAKPASSIISGIAVFVNGAKIV
ncbi:hypothetical protein EDB81DRAFT_838201 [Dactylonectria macrodidyma]|uniref:Uncharacterized protein n=1 Tax=Dactylonectria macrodidyma TaxID=307937 RepID=A0A9P9FK87_9HYPO|nr:hypothetical protein EDB81DRAFT_838201 [Dactylonectria macrodidyma]